MEGRPMLARLTHDQLDAIAPIGSDGAVNVEADALSSLLAGILGEQSVRVAITMADYDQHPDGVPEPSTRSVRGIAWSPAAVENRSKVWSFRTDALALSITDEGEHDSPVSEDADLIARAILVIADQYPGSIVKEPSARIEAQLPSGRKQIRVVVTHDARVVRVEDVINGMELIAYNAGRLAVAMVKPVEDGKALVTKFGF